MLFYCYYHFTQITGSWPKVLGEAKKVCSFDTVFFYLRHLTYYCTNIKNRCHYVSQRTDFFSQLKHVK